MASIFKRKNKNGTTVWRAIIRIKGYPTICDHFDRKQEAEDWYVATLSTLFTYATTQINWISENPTLSLKKLKENPGRDRVLTEEEISRLLVAARESKSPFLYCIIPISLTTGARQRETFNLEWKHIDFENKLAYIKETKNGHPRSIALCEPVIEELKRLYEKRDPLKPLVFASKTAFGRIDIKKSWQHAPKKANIKKGFAEKNLRRIIQFAEVFPNEQIVVSLIRQLSWTHFIALVPIKDPLKRDFYSEMCRIEKWNVRTLRSKIDSMLYERTALSKHPESLVRAEMDTLQKEDRLTPDLIFRDPYVLDFLKLNDHYMEKDLTELRTSVRFNAITY